MKHTKRWLPFTMGISVMGLVAWYGWKFYDYLDHSGSLFMTIGESIVDYDQLGHVAEYASMLPEGKDTIMILLQRGILHTRGSRSFTSSLFVDPMELHIKRQFHYVQTMEGERLYKKVNGSYSIFGIEKLPDGLIAIEADGMDTIRFTLHRQLRPYPAEPPDIPWWAEPLRILTSP